MAKKNSADFQLEKASGELLITTSAAQKTSNFQPIDCYVNSAIFNTTADATVANTTTQTTLIGTGTGTKTLPVNFLAAAKRVIVHAEGYITNLTTPTINIVLKFGSTSILATGAQTMSAITGTRRWVFDGTVTCRTAGGSGTVIGQGEFRYYTLATTMVGVDVVNTATTTVDTTATQALDLMATWGTASASNSITCTNATFSVDM